MDNDMPTRLPWDEYFMNIAEEVGSRATCDRAHVGCLLVKDNHILSTGYNGSVPGEFHCDDAGHIMEDNHCVRTNHAEANAISQAAKHGTAVEGSTAYCTHLPCNTCAKLLLCAGVKDIVFRKEYGTNKLSPRVVGDKFTLRTIN